MLQLNNMRQILTGSFFAVILLLAAQTDILGQEFNGITGPTCVPTGSTQNYSLVANPGGFSYSVSGGALTTGGSTGSATASSKSISVVWSSTSGTIILTQPGYSASLSVQMFAAPTGGSINYNSTQRVNPGSVPDSIKCSAPSGGLCSACTSNCYTYQWQTSTDQATWTSTGLATANLGFTTGISGTIRYYRRRTTGEGGATAYSNTAWIYVNQPLVIGSVAPVSQTINYGANPSQLSLQGFSGGNLIYNFVWQQSADNVSWNGTGAPSVPSYTPPSLTGIRYYRVVVSSNGDTLTSASVTVTGLPAIQSGSPAPVSQVIPYNTASATLSLSGTSGGDGTYSYAWMFCPTVDGIYAPVGVTGATYSPGTRTSGIYYKVIVTSHGASDTSDPFSIYVLPRPTLMSGNVVPGSLTIASGTSPGLLTVNAAAGGVCSGSYAYQWQQSSDGTSFSSVGVTTPNYTPGALTAPTWYRRRVVCGTDTAYTNAAAITIGSGVGSVDNLNYIRMRDVTKPGVTDTVTANQLTDLLDVKQTMQYFDGLGRVMQTVTRQASPLGKDMVIPTIYDEFGREGARYLPYVASSQDGKFRPNALAEQATFNQAQFPGEQYYYGQTDYEPSPLQRVVKGYAAGSSWVGGSRGIESQYLLNSGSDSVAIWTIAAAAGSKPVRSGIYASGLLFKNVTIDEQGHMVVEYKDQEGHVILKKVQLTDNPYQGHTGWMCTYYVYDDLDNLRFVIQPKAVDLLKANGWDFANGAVTTVADELCFRYDYDARKRMIIKKVPGAGEVRMVYDARDRLVMSQDSVLRSQQQWLMTSYDALNRQDSVALMTDPAHYNDQGYHLTQALSSPIYPNPASYSINLQTQLYYDTYDWVTALGNSLTASPNTANNSNSTYFFTSFNVSPSYAVAMTQYPIATGMPTGMRTKVIGTSQFIYNIPFYDDHGRVIQTENTNYTNAIDLESTQYDFTGKPLRKLLVHRKNGNLGMGHIALTKYAYDASGRMTSLRKITDGGADKVIDTLMYNELGQLRARYLGNNMDSLVYDYNIRGWVTGINRKYLTAASNNYFGMELGYDKPNSFTGLTTFFNLQYNGNIAGIIWKGAGDNVCRKYDFGYDNANRLRGADYTQSTGGGFGRSPLIDFSVRIDSYDVNGNILKMKQIGYKVGGSSAIDSLTYNYANSNKLLGVTDLVNDVSSKLGDFHYDPATKGATDYTYDGNGNLVSDKNKGIRSIQYNFLNLPQLISFTKADGSSKGTIEYKYDGQGTKLLKIVTDSTVTPVKITNTLYAAGFQYENDSARFWGHEEGRTRYFMKHYMNGDSSFRILNDYFEKDHLGNIRAILTEDRDTARYIATMEGAYRAKERALFYNIDETAYPRSAVTGYPVDTSVTNPNDTVSKLDGNTKTMGPGILLKVMRGDSILIVVKGFYQSTGSTAGGTSDAFNTILSSLASGLAGMTGAAHGGSVQLSGSGNPVFGALNTFRGVNNTTPATTPKAYLNWMLLDNQFQYVSAQSGAQAFTTPDMLDPKATSLGLKTSGYLYIWVSNETKGWDMFFDNLSVTHYTGPLVEENHYYPFGLAMAGISDKALKGNYVENKYRGNGGDELQNKEFRDGGGLELYDAFFRGYDPQLGRFCQQDPLMEVNENWSPYSFVNDNPVSFSDALGLEDSVRGLRPYAPAPIIRPGKLASPKPVNVGRADTKGDAPDPGKLAEAVPALPSSPLSPVPPPGIVVPMATPLLEPLVGDALLAAPMTGILVLLPLSAPGEGLHWKPWPGHGNNKDNSDPHIVYAFGFAAKDGKTPVLKYGISDEYKNGFDRPESQLAGFRLKYGPTVMYSIYARTISREMALFIERQLVSEHVDTWNEMPREQDRPLPFP